MAYTVFFTYLLAQSGLTGYGYSQAIHCNYIKSVVLNTTTPQIMELNMNFYSASDFKFLTTNLANGTGYTANKIYAVFQIVSGTTTAKPLSANWKLYDITPSTHVAGTPLSATELMGNFTIDLSKFYLTGTTTYNLSYLSYPTTLPTDDDKLCFGDEVYFLGNVSTEIHADVYATDLSIVLPLNQFNSSTNPTWIAASPQPPVSISEIGIYDSNKNLVAIAKLNNPIDKSSAISRTILFAMDF